MKLFQLATKKKCLINIINVDIDFILDMIASKNVWGTGRTTLEEMHCN